MAFNALLRSHRAPNRTHTQVYRLPSSSTPGCQELEAVLPLPGSPHDLLTPVYVQGDMIYAAKLPGDLVAQSCPILTSVVVDRFVLDALDFAETDAGGLQPAWPYLHLNQATAATTLEYEVLQARLALQTSGSPSASIQAGGAAQSTTSRETLVIDAEDDDDDHDMLHLVSREDTVSRHIQVGFPGGLPARR